MALTMLKCNTGCLQIYKAAMPDFLVFDRSQLLQYNGKQNAVSSVGMCLLKSSADSHGSIDNISL